MWTPSHRQRRQGCGQSHRKSHPVDKSGEAKWGNRNIGTTGMEPEKGGRLSTEQENNEVVERKDRPDGKKGGSQACRTYQERQYCNRKNNNECKDSEDRGCPCNPRSWLVVPQVLDVGVPEQARDSRPGERRDTLKDRYRRHDWRRWRLCGEGTSN